MNRKILFISDLHLNPEQPDTGRLFIDFLQTEASTADSLYILGDLFELWLGDDAVLPAYQPFIDALRALTDHGVSLYVMHGNRDFLLGDRFQAMTGAQLLSDPTVIDLAGTATLLMHGDLLCTDDVAYQQFRAMVHDPEWQRALFNKSMSERLELARQLRQESRTATGKKSTEIMDVNQQTVKDIMRSYKVHQLIHGHTHRPAQHRFDLDGQPAMRFVLPEWSGQQGGGLLYDKLGLRNKSYTLTQSS
ncbi:MAG TPA: UDP-2,3-diacylglucosamine diphosphatase [Gammaproteobacteria bacterium]|nr:UDP-2,3-diacylglucosamine diphosphatase [Gammaproteobacteria bacterium]